MYAEPVPSEGFLGRREELQGLYRRACGAGTGAAESLVLAGDRGTGKTALLQQLAAQLFWKQERVTPFLYTGTEALLSVADFARDYLASFLRHRFAFDQRDQSLLSSVGMPLSALAAHAIDRGANWAAELIERVQQNAEDPISQLQTALYAPERSARETGRPVLVIIDDYPVLAGLHRGDIAEPSLLSLFHGPMSMRLTPHMVAGSPAALRDLPLPVLTEVPLQPMPFDDATQLFHTLLQVRGVTPMSIPRSLIDQLNGNPLYIRRVAGAMSGVSAAREEEFWSAYVGEITGGALYCYFAGTLKALFPTVSERRSALEVLHRIYSAGNEPSTGRAVRALVDQKLAPGSLQALMRTGLVLGAFGEYRAPADPVLRDFVSLLYEREIAGRAPDEIRRIAHAGRRPVPEATWDLSVPLAPRSELVIAESIEQIGKNLHFSEDAIGQLQLAVIEACINAIEHSKGGGGRLSVSIRSLPDRLEVSVESPGPEFVLAETGEPVVGTFDAKGSQRGQGVKLMKRFADAVRFERTARGNRVVLVKNVVRTAPIKEGASHRE